MKRLLSMLCVVICLLGMVVLTGCGDPAEDEKAKQIKQSRIDIFDPAIYQTGTAGAEVAIIGSMNAFKKDPDGTPLCPSYEIYLEPKGLVEQFSDPALFNLLSDTLIYMWNEEATSQVDGSIDRMPDLKPDGARPPVLSGNTDRSHETTEILFCEGVPNIGDYLFSQRPELTRVYLPDSVTEIGEHAFADGCQTTIYCHRGSCAERYAKDHGLSYQLI